MPDPINYETTDGKTLQGSYFFHSQMWDKPCDRDMVKAQALVMDLVEDYFLTYDGKRNQVASKYISIS